MATSTSTDDLFSPTRAEGRDDIQLHRILLDLPALLIELALVPVLPLVVLNQRHAVGLRFYDLFTSDDRTLGLVPFIEPFDMRGSGLGFGALFFHHPRGWGPRTTVRGLARTNGDYDIEGEITHPLVGRQLWLGLTGDHGRDSDRRFYGTGSGTHESDERRFRDLSTAAFAEIFWGGFAEGGPTLGSGLAVLRQEYGFTTEDDEPTVRFDEGPYPPPGFGRTSHYGELRFRAAYDTRDRTGSPSRGLLLTAGVSLARALDDAPLSAFHGGAEFFGFIPVLEPDRVLVLSGGVSTSEPLAGSHEIPFPLYTFFGGSDVLRGYPANRFAGEHGWWSTIEFRYPIWRVPGSDARLSAFLFGDVGQVGDRWQDLIDGPIPFSVGIGARIETALDLLARFQLAVSSEGVRVSAAIGGL